MASQVQSERINSAPVGAKFLVQLIAESTQSTKLVSESEFLAIALKALNQSIGATGSAMVQGTKGQWRILAHAGEGDGLPDDHTEIAGDHRDDRQQRNQAGGLLGDDLPGPPPRRLP